MTIKIRQAIESDRVEISLPMSQLGYESSSEVILENLRTIAASRADEVYIAEEKGRVLGVIACHLTKLFHQAGYAGRITSLVVDEKIQTTKCRPSIKPKAF